ncbi:MAG TPA: SDR family oxidoreductase [Candidatus Saccharimonadales bacterium]|jgi:short-subunit dehydrogenase
MNTFFKDKIVSVTGGSSGMGAELVRQLSAQGATVIIGARNPVPAESLVAELAASGAAVSYTPIDIGKPEDCERFFAAIMQRHGRLDYAFNSAGIIMGGEIRDHAIEDVQKILTTNVLGTSYCSFYAYRIMSKQKSGHIINFSSGAGLFPLPLMGVYSASKFAITGLSEALRLEGKSLGVKVSAVTPGLVDTPIYDTGIYSKTDKAEAKKLLQKSAYMIQPDKAVRKILRGTQRNKPVIFTQWYVYSSWLSYRIVPAIYRAVVGQLLGPYRKRMRRP